MAVTTWTAGQVLAAQDLNDTFASKLDTSLYLPGLELIENETVSSVGNVSINSCFSDATGYLVVLSRGVHSSTDAGIGFRLRASGSDDTGSNYDYQSLLVDGTSVTGARSASQATWIIGQLSNTRRSSTAMFIYAPGTAFNTHFRSVSQSAKSDAAMADYAGTHSQTTAYDGFTIFVGTGTFGGNIRVYEMR